MSKIYIAVPKDRGMSWVFIISEYIFDPLLHTFLPVTFCTLSTVF